VFAVVRDPRQMPGLAAQGAVPVLADVSADSSTDAVRAALAGVPAVDLLINNAAVIRYGTELEKVETQDVLESVNVNCLGALRMVQACLPWLKRSSHGVLLNVSSRHASLGLAARGGAGSVPVSYSYRVSKAALNMLTVAMHQELSRLGIDAVAVHPGRVRSRNAPPDADLSVDEAARRILNGVSTGLLAGGRFLEPGVAAVIQVDW
jgi:NAD(P)-dependent dehydrogenase (short-subunit alcohol dehydrogenase family)